MTKRVAVPVTLTELQTPWDIVSVIKAKAPKKITFTNGGSISFVKAKRKVDRDAAVMRAMANDFEQGLCNFMRNMLKTERESITKRLRKIAKRLENIK